jgi:hypothetical protein
MLRKSLLHAAAYCAGVCMVLLCTSTPSHMNAASKMKRQPVQLAMPTAAAVHTCNEASFNLN